MLDALLTKTLQDKPYWLMDGLGNDFVIIDLRRGGTMTPEIARALGDRDGPFGCDQIITVKGDQDLPEMGIWNADGGEVEACGNAARCVAWLAMEATGNDKAMISTKSGLLKASRAERNRICVDMAPPKLSWQDIPLAEQMDDTRFIDVKLGPIDAPILWGPAAVNMGNPHVVFFVQDVDAQALDRYGPMVENHPLFPERTNVSIAEKLSPTALKVRTWERGVGLTQACGTAACAALVSAVRRRVIEREADIHLPGGSLRIKWREEDDHVLMTGPVRLNGQGAFGQFG